MIKRIFHLTAWLIIPASIAAFSIGLLAISDYRGANIITKLRVELLIIGITVIIALIWGLTKGLTSLGHSKTQTALNKQRNQHKEEHQRFIQRLDHELKNPVTAIQLGLENLEQQSPESQDKIFELKILLNRLTQLTTDLRKLTSFEKQKLSIEDVNIDSLLRETVDLVKEQFPSRELTLSLPAAPWPVPNIRADHDLLQLAIYNLLENAIKYSDKGDHIELRANDDNNTVKIEIADTGMGIPASEMTSVWEELFRASNSHNREGTGIGLSLVKRIIERLHGKINIDSIEKKGTRVSITLPTHVKT